MIVCDASHCIDTIDTTDSMILQYVDNIFVITVIILMHYGDTFLCLKSS